MNQGLGELCGMATTRCRNGGTLGGPRNCGALQNEADG